MFYLKRNFAFVAGLALLVPLMFPAPSQAFFSITIYFGVRNCSPGFGICGIVIDLDNEARMKGDLSRGIHPDRRIPNGEASAVVEPDQNAREANRLYLKIEMKSALPKPESVMPVAEDLVLDAATSKAIGFRSATVLKGNYKVDHSKNKHGTVLLNIQAHN